MKRRLVFGAVLAALIGMTTPSWALDLKWGGDLRLRGFYIDNLTDQDKDTNDSAAYMSSRFLLTTSAIQDNVSGVATLIVGRSFQNGSGNRLLGATPYGPESSTDMAFLEAYLKAEFSQLTFTGGRKVYKLGHGIILDDAVDGLWFDVKSGPAVVTLASLKILEQTNSTVVGIGNSPNVGSGGDADLYVANAAFGTMFGGMHTDVFLTYLSDREAALFGGGGPGNAGDDATLWTLGVMDGRTIGSMHLHGELDYLNGKAKIGGVSDDLKGLNFTVGAKVETGTVPIGVDLIYTSGQDQNSTSEANVNGLNGNYPVGIIITNSGARSLDTKDGTCLSVMGPGNGSGSLGGSNGCIGGSGLTAIKVSTGITHGPHVVDVAAIWANASEDPDGGGVGKKDVGIELDATVTMELAKKLSLLGGVGYLMSGDFYKTAGNSNPDPQTVLVTELSYKF